MKNFAKKISLLLLFLLLSSLLQAQNSPAPLKLVEFLLTPDHDDWNYRPGDDPVIKIAVLKNDVPVRGALVSYQTGTEMMEADKKAELLLQDGTGEIRLGTTNSPGFRQMRVETNVGGHKYESIIKIAFSPEEIRPTVTLPADFMQFWRDNRMESMKIPLDPVLTPLPEQSTSTVDVYLVNIQHTKIGQRLYGYLCKPKKPGKYPVIFSPPGAGIKPMAVNTSLAGQGFITLSIEIHGLSPLIDPAIYKSISTAFGEYWLTNLSDPNEYYYKKVYLGCLRAVDFLCSLPEFDGKNVAVSGGSQGGALAIVTAALHPQVKCLVSFYPALCDVTGYLHNRAGGWPHMFSTKKAPVTNRPENLKTMGYYDVVNFARQIKIPGFYSWGYNDNTCPPTSVFSAINSINAPKKISITPITGHWRFEETNIESIAWIREQFKN